MTFINFLFNQVNFVLLKAHIHLVKNKSKNSSSLCTHTDTRTKTKQNYFDTKLGSGIVRSISRRCRCC